MTTIQNTDVQERGIVWHVTILMIVIREDVGDAGNLEPRVEKHTRVPSQEETGTTVYVLGQDSGGNVREHMVHLS